MKHLLIIFAFIAVLLLLAGGVVSRSPYGYDEADYMYATRFGFVANSTDTPSMSLLEFLRIGMKRGRDSSQSSQLSELIRSSNDILFYRHWHGPLYFYWLILTSHLATDEHQTRLFTLIFPVCTLLVIYAGCLWIFGGTQGTLAAIAASVLFASSVPVVRSSELAPHQPFACCVLICLIFLSKTAAEGNRTYFYYAVIASALSFCLLEVGFVAVATVIVCGYLERHRLGLKRVLVTRSLLLFVASALVVWTGAIIKLSFVKSYIFMAYLALFRKSSWGQEGLAATWKLRLAASPVEWLVIGLSLVILIVLLPSQRDRRLFYPFVAYTLLMLAVTARVTSAAPRYALIFQPVLDVLAGCILAAWLIRLRHSAATAALAATLGLLLVAETLVNVKRNPVPPDPTLTSLLAYVRQNHLECARMLVPQDDLPSLHYYFPNSQLRGYTIQNISNSRPDSTEGFFYPGLPIRYEAPLSSTPGQIR